MSIEQHCTLDDLILHVWRTGPGNCFVMKIIKWKSFKCLKYKLLHDLILWVVCHLKYTWKRIVKPLFRQQQWLRSHVIRLSVPPKLTQERLEELFQIQHKYLPGLEDELITFCEKVKFTVTSCPSHACESQKFKIAFMRTWVYQLKPSAVTQKQLNSDSFAGSRLKKMGIESWIIKPKIHCQSFPASLWRKHIHQWTTSVFPTDRKQQVMLRKIPSSTRTISAVCSPLSTLMTPPQERSFKLLKFGGDMTGGYRLWHLGNILCVWPTTSSKHTIPPI